MLNRDTDTHKVFTILSAKCSQMPITNAHRCKQVKQHLDKHMYTRYSHTIMLTDASKFETTQIWKLTYNLPTTYPHQGTFS